MKWITAIALGIVAVAVAAMLLVARSGTGHPPQFENMATSAGMFPSPKGNLFVNIWNQTRTELSVEGVVDNATTFGGAVNRDQHFGTCGVGLMLPPGEHTVTIRILRQAPVTKQLSFRTAPGTTNHIAVSIFRDGDAGYRIEMRQSQKGFGIL